MVASLFFSCVIFAVFQEFASANCPISADVHEYVIGQCIYVVESAKAKSDVEKTCRDLHTTLKSGHRWYLPKLDTKEKSDEMAAKITRVKNQPGWQSWIGLVRDDAANGGANLTSAEWADYSKWRWSVDNTSLADSYDSISSKAPWSANEPNNNRYSRPERCVLFQSKNNKSTWDDYPCNWAGSTLVVCEANAVATTTSIATTTTIVTTPTTAPTKATTTIPPIIETTSTTSTSQPKTDKAKEFEEVTDKPSKSSVYYWVFGSILVVVVLCAVFLISVWYVRRRKRQEKKAFGIVSTMTDIGSTATGNATTRSVKSLVGASGVWPTSKQVSMSTKSTTTKKGTSISTSSAVGISKKVGPSSTSSVAGASKKTESVSKMPTTSVGASKKESLLKKTSSRK